MVPLRLEPVTVPLAESDVAEAAPKVGVTSVGLVAKTNAPDPVSSLTAARRFAEDGVPRKVATPDPRLVKPVPPFATATGDVSEKTDPVSVSPVPAVNVPAPLNCDQGNAVVPRVDAIARDDADAVDGLRSAQRDVRGGRGDARGFRVETLRDRVHIKFVSDVSGCGRRGRDRAGRDRQACDCTERGQR